MLRPCVHNLDIHTSLIESFATLFFLSAMKIQSVSLDLLTPTPLYYPDGTTSKSLYLYLAGNIKYFDKHHSLYGVLVIIIISFNNLHFTSWGAVLWLSLLLFPTIFKQDKLQLYFFDNFYGHFSRAL